MARKFQSGFEVEDFNDSAPFVHRTVEWSTSGIDVVGDAVLDTSIYHGGNASIKFNSGGSISRSASSMGLANFDDIYMRFYFRISFTNNVYRRILLVQDPGSLPWIGLSLKTDMTLELAIVDNSNVVLNSLVTSATALSINRWHMIEVRIKSGNAGVGIVELRLDGVSQGSNNSIEIPDNNAVFNLDGTGNLSGSNIWYDDVAINDPTGSFNNSWPGEGFIETMLPNSDVATGAWTAVGGAGPLFDAVDDGSNPDEDTSYVVSVSATLNNEVRFGLTDVSEFYQDGAEAAAVTVGILVKGTGTQSRTVKTQLRDANNNTQDGADFNWGDTTFYASYHPTLTIERTMGGSPVAITKSYVNGLQLAFIETNSNNREVRCTAAWVNVEFKEPRFAPIMQAIEEDWNGVIPVSVSG